MLANLICWLLAWCIILTSSAGLNDFYTRLVLAMGFILLGTISKAVDTYRMVHTQPKEENKNT